MPFIVLAITWTQSALAVVTPQTEAGIRLATAPLEMAVQHASKFKKDVALRNAINAWLQDSLTACRDGREAMRSKLLTLLYALGDPVSLAFADVFVPESTTSPKRPHPPTSEELALSVVFKMPSVKDMEVMRFATMDDHVENLQSSAIKTAIALRRELGLAEIQPPYTQWKSFPKDRESTIPWVLALVKEALHSHELAERLAERYELLSRLSYPLKDTNTESNTLSVPSHRFKTLPELTAPEPTPAPLNQKPNSSTPWSIIVVLIVAAVGLPWLLVKKRN